jgi:hypothetical protein
VLFGGNGDSVIARAIATTIGHIPFSPNSYLMLIMMQGQIIQKEGRVKKANKNNTHYYYS